jgi:Ca2+-binding RTX toxin-like protein
MADLVNGLGGEVGFGENHLLRNDDGSNSYSEPIDLTSVFPDGLNFFGQTWTGVYVNNNGNITFGNSLSEYTPTSIGENFQDPIIAPFWGDVDTRNMYNDSITNNVTPTPGGTSMGSNLTWYDLDADAKTFTVTWDDVGYYDEHTDKLNAFQLQLISTDNGNFDIVYRYEDVNWVTGDASSGTNGLGGTVARAGFSAGDGSNYYEFYFSGDQNFMLNLENTQLLGASESGVWTYHVNGGSVQGIGLENSDDTVNGTDGSDILDGRSGNDILQAGLGDDNVSGGEGDDSLYGGLGNDILVGGTGNDILDGGDGLDTALFSGDYADYTITPGDNGISISGIDGSDTAENIERIDFSDMGLAFDVDGHAGEVARILGAVFGSSSVSNANYAGIGLFYLDGGTMDYEALMVLAIGVTGASSNEAIVSLLWHNLMGSEPTLEEAQPYVNMLDNHEMSIGQLGVFAADTSINATNIDLTGIEHAGLQYDIQ